MVVIMAMWSPWEWRLWLGDEETSLLLEGDCVRIVQNGDGNAKTFDSENIPRLMLVP